MTGALIPSAPIPPTVALPLIKHRIDMLRRGLDENSTLLDRAVLGIIEDLTAVVEQLAAAVAP